MDGQSELRAKRDELEGRLLALEQAIEAQRPPQWWEGSPQVNDLAERSTELLRQLGAVNDKLVAMGPGPASDQE
ncbi:hypothetical protein [Azohydromonas caseinilytica]|uniref:Uncharacterized protein n=1 Tax=Azohydromonas caseinilytica TaxID=2728836 RepID=A0A848FDS5_9BURK|nr:hypothetical protein [Azohydromonas caseinilytica]NML16965.1 hypothetical protein [Azohydromonas caseinilytica]